ncbi:hypothetical protein ABT009_40965 [Streptomyces sp. NPDC002896]|uniref:hypothetical protein n=1 Tax=Streptomyces sp. NPDC002896 TaxID=3154438 RepID=UPI00332942AD
MSDTEKPVQDPKPLDDHMSGGGEDVVKPLDDHMSGGTEGVVKPLDDHMSDETA